MRDEEWTGVEERLERLDREMGGEDGVWEE